MKDGIHLVLWVFIGALIVLVVTHAQGFATAVTAVGGQVTNNAVLLAGGNPVVNASVPGLGSAKAQSYTGLQAA